MIDPAHLAHFWGPKGMSTPLETITVDARPGGVFETVMVNDADGSRYPTRAIYDIVDEPETLAWTETGSGMKVTVRFVALGERRTQVEIHEVGVPRGRHDPPGTSRVPHLTRPFRDLPDPTEPTAQGGTTDDDHHH